MENKKEQLPFPQKLFNDYLKKVSIDEEKDLNKDNVENLFRILAEDFRNEKLSLEHFSMICGQLYTYFSNLGDEDWLSEKYSSIKNILEVASDLSYQVRHPGNTLIEYLQDIITYPDYLKIK
jgi:hypothetical protein